jgi:NAD(P)-dependent dehydrogenase (short-subunit alcohol dehydrogenase family)
MISRIQTGKMSTARIVNIGSISAYTSSPSRAEYCISKAGMGMVDEGFRRPPGGNTASTCMNPSGHYRDRPDQCG